MLIQKLLVYKTKWAFSLIDERTISSQFNIRYWAINSKLEIKRNSIRIIKSYLICTIFAKYTK